MKELIKQPQHKYKKNMKKPHEGFRNAQIRRIALSVLPPGSRISKDAIQVLKDKIDNFASELTSLAVESSGDHMRLRCDDVVQAYTLKENCRVICDAPSDKSRKRMKSEKTKKKKEDDTVSDN